MMKIQPKKMLQKLAGVTEVTIRNRIKDLRSKGIASIALDYSFWFNLYCKEFPTN